MAAVWRMATAFCRRRKLFCRFGRVKYLFAKILFCHVGVFEYCRPIRRRGPQSPASGRPSPDPETGPSGLGPPTTCGLACPDAGNGRTGLDWEMGLGRTGHV